MIPRVSDPERMFSADKPSSFLLKMYVNTELKSKNVPFRCVPRLTTHLQFDSTYQMENIIFMKISLFFSVALKAHRSSSDFGKGIRGAQSGNLFLQQSTEDVQKLPLQQNFAPSLGVCAALRNDGSPACAAQPSGLVQNPSEAVSSCSKWTDLAKDCPP